MRIFRSLTVKVFVTYVYKPSLECDNLMKWSWSHTLKESLTPISSEVLTSLHFLKKLTSRYGCKIKTKLYSFLIFIIPKHWTSEVNNAKTKNSSNAKLWRYILCAEAIIPLYFFNLHYCTINYQNTKVPELITRVSNIFEFACREINLWLKLVSKGKKLLKNKIWNSGEFNFELNNFFCIFSKIARFNTP